MVAKIFAKIGKGGRKYFRKNWEGWSQTFSQKLGRVVANIFAKIGKGGRKRFRKNWEGWSQIFSARYARKKPSFLPGYTKGCP